MPAYCTPQDLVDRYGQAELLQLASAEDGTLDTLRLQRACDDAGDMVDGYIRPRLVLPLSSVPRLLTRLSCAIARYDLHLGGDRQPTDQVTKEREHAIAFLRDVAAGKADLGLGTNGAEPVEDAGGITVQPGEGRGVTSDDLSHYRLGGRW